MMNNHGMDWIGGSRGELGAWSMYCTAYWIFRAGLSSGFGSVKRGEGGGYVN